MINTHTRKILLMTILAWAVAGPLQAQNDDNATPPIYPNLAADLVDSGVPVIDVRSNEEVEESGVLADAEHIVHTDVDAIARFIGEDTDRTVVIYCGSGRRAGMVIDALSERGYTGLVNAGGHTDLQEAIEGGENEAESDGEDAENEEDADG